MLIYAGFAKECRMGKGKLFHNNTDHGEKGKQILYHWTNKIHKVNKTNTICAILMLGVLICIISVLYVWPCPCINTISITDLFFLSLSA